MRIHIYEATVSKVVDGDTVDLLIDQGFGNFTEQRMRLYGVNAAEIKTKEGKRVKREVQIAIEQKKIVVQSVQRKVQSRDKYGRYLAVVHFDWPNSPLPIANGDKINDAAPLSFNAKMLKDGLAEERYW
jgi:micrococcal nuclease